MVAKLIHQVVLFYEIFLHLNIPSLCPEFFIHTAEFNIAIIYGIYRLLILSLTYAAPSCMCTVFAEVQPAELEIYTSIN